MAKIIGVHLEGIFINPVKKGIHNPAHFLELSKENFQLIEDDIIEILYIVSKARRDKRRASVSKLTAPARVACKKCGELITPHTVCSACGFYDGKEVIKKDEK